MGKQKPRNELLADVAEMYYVHGENQSEIAKQIGVTRSMISRMLAEARDLGIVQIQIERPVRFDDDLGRSLERLLNLNKADVLIEHPDQELRTQLGLAGAKLVLRYLQPNQVLGIPWGTTVSEVVSALQAEYPISMSVVQLVGALGAKNQDYDGHALVNRLVETFGGEGYYLNAPFFSKDEKTAKALLFDKGIRQTLQKAEECDLALLGVGSIIKSHSSFYNAGYIDEIDFNMLVNDGAVGDVCGLHFDIDGTPKGLEFEKRTVNIGRNRLKKIERRIGIAGGKGKTEAILGAVRAGYINELITNRATARALLEYSQPNK